MAAQVAGELYETLTGQLFELGRQLRQPNGYPFNPEHLKVALQNAIEGRFGDVKMPSWLSVIATTQLDEAICKSTKDCFTGSRYAYRDGDFDCLLGKKQRPASASVISTIAFTKDWTFVEAAAKVLGIGAGSSVKLMGQALIENGHTMTLVQAENMVEATERGDKTGMRTDGYANFFFVETGNEEEPVSVANVNRDVSRWRAYVYRLGYGIRWNADNRLLVRNLDASKLGS